MGLIEDQSITHFIKAFKPTEPPMTPNANDKKVAPSVKERNGSCTAEGDIFFLSSVELQQRG